jgi:hypothetical protein
MSHMFRNLFIIFFLGLISCQEKKTEIPDEIIGKDKMTLMLTDLCLMEGAINISYTNPAVQKNQLLKFNLFKQHDVTRKQFDLSMMYYCRHIEDFREIQAKVLEELNKKK